MLDGHFSVGLRDYEICHADAIYIQLPYSETAFEDGFAVKTAPLRATSTESTESLDLYAAAVRMTSLRRDIMSRV